MDLDVRSGVAAGTLVLLDTKLKPIEDVVTGMEISKGTSSDKFITYGVIHDRVITTNFINQVPTIFTKQFTDLKFSNGYHFECLPLTKILTAEGYVTAFDLTLNSYEAQKEPVDIVSYQFNNEKGFVKTFIKVEHADTSIKTLEQKIYVTRTDCHNLLLPYAKEGSDSLSFICIYQ